MRDLTGKDIGRYHIIEQLGKGGMAVVYKAFDRRLVLPVARALEYAHEQGVVHQGVLLRRQRPERGMHRWYRVVVMQDIFGEWAACFLGSTLSRFQQHRMVYAGSEAEAREQTRKIVKARKARGYGEIEHQGY